MEENNNLTQTDVSSELERLRIENAELKKSMATSQQSQIDAIRASFEVKEAENRVLEEHKAAIEDEYNLTSELNKLGGVYKEIAETVKKQGYKGVQATNLLKKLTLEQMALDKEYSKFIPELFMPRIVEFNGLNEAQKEEQASKIFDLFYLTIERKAGSIRDAARAGIANPNNDYESKFIAKARKNYNYFNQQGAN